MDGGVLWFPSGGCDFVLAIVLGADEIGKWVGKLAWMLIGVEVAVQEEQAIAQCSVASYRGMRRHGEPELQKWSCQC